MRWAILACVAIVVGLGCRGHESPAPEAGKPVATATFEDEGEEFAYLSSLSNPTVAQWKRLRTLNFQATRLAQIQKAREALALAKHVEKTRTDGEAFEIYKEALALEELLPESQEAEDARAGYKRTEAFVKEQERRRAEAKAAREERDRDPK